MGIIYTLILAFMCFSLVLLCDFLMLKVPKHSHIGEIIREGNVRWVFAYMEGMTLFLVGIGVFSQMI